MAIRTWSPKVLLLIWVLWPLAFAALTWGSLALALWRAARAQSEIFLVIAPGSVALMGLFLFGPPAALTWYWHRVRQR
ncbi:MAG TPA: hypothetical protein VFS33_11480 [Gemmatimonadales bacterium]|nr:hypothetical protein [Gemmatimonadales bacterium]